MTAAIAIVIKADGTAIIAEAKQASLSAGDGADPNMDALTVASAEAAAGMQQAAAAAFNLDAALKAAGSGGAGSVAGGAGSSDSQAPAEAPSFEERIGEILDLADLAKRAGDQVGEAFENAGDRAADALGEMVVEGEFKLGTLGDIFDDALDDIGDSFKQLGKDLLGDVFGALKNELLGGFGGAGGFGGGAGFGGGGGGGPGGLIAQLAAGFIQSQIAHTGGVIGRDRFGTRLLYSDLVNGAPRFQTGGIVGKDEVPILAHQGEGVFTPGQMAALGGGLQSGTQEPGRPPVNVNINVTAGVPEAVRREFVKLIPQIEGIVRRVVSDDLSRNRGIRQAFER